MARSQMTRYRNRTGMMGLAGMAYKYGPRIAGRIGKTAGSFTNSYRRSAGSNPTATRTDAPTTFQHDTRSTYTRRKAPHRVVRRARRAAQQFQKNLATVLGLKSFVNNSYSSAVIPANGQAAEDIPFMNNTTMGNLFNLFGVDGAPTAISGVWNTSVVPNNELMVQNYRAEVEFKNTGSSLVYLDLYYYYPRKDTAIAAAVALNDGQDGTGNGATFVSNVLTSSSISKTSMGVTPFQFSAFTENFVVYKTRRIMLQANASASITQKSGRVGNQSNRDWFGLNLRRNCSTGVIAIASTELAGTAGGTVAGSLSWHKQEWVSVYKNGGQGAKTISVVQNAI